MRSVQRAARRQAYDFSLVCLLKVEKELSFGERKMLDSARSLLLRELSLASGLDELRAQDEVRAIFNL